MYSISPFSLPGIKLCNNSQKLRKSKVLSCCPTLLDFSTLFQILVQECNLLSWFIPFNMEKLTFFEKMKLKSMMKFIETCRINLCKNFQKLHILESLSPRKFLPFTHLLHRSSKFYRICSMKFSSKKDTVSSLAYISGINKLLHRVLSEARIYV